MPAIKKAAFCGDFAGWGDSSDFGESSGRAISDSLPDEDCAAARDHFAFPKDGSMSDSRVSLRIAGCLLVAVLLCTSDTRAQAIGSGVTAGEPVSSSMVLASSRRSVIS